MTTAEFLADTLLANLNLLKITLADFSDADMLVRPCPGANHAAWQLGHLIVAEANLTNLAKAGVAPELPAGFADRFKKENSTIDDAAAFAAKDLMLELLVRGRAATGAWIGALSNAELEAKMPEKVAHLAPTVGHLGNLLQGHVMMHVGQFQVIRRKLGKPVIF